ncbi:MAG TPA: alpha-amylase, partial [Candidatus Binatia bacterium]
QPIVRDGRWQLLDCVPAWDRNFSSDDFIACTWQGSDGQRVLVAVNYAPHQSQCYIRLPLPEIGGRAWRLKDLMGPACYDRDGNNLQSPGLYLDVAAWQYHVFEMSLLS